MTGNTIDEADCTFAPLLLRAESLLRRPVAQILAWVVDQQHGQQNGALPHLCGLVERWRGHCSKMARLDECSCVFVRQTAFIAGWCKLHLIGPCTRAARNMKVVRPTRRPRPLTRTLYGVIEHVDYENVVLLLLLLLP